MPGAEIVVSVAVTAVVVSIPLVGLYIRERIKNLAREGTEKKLEDYRHDHEKLPESLKAIEARRSTEYSLYA